MVPKEPMEYTKTFNELKSVFTIENKKISIPGSDIEIHNIDFRSDAPLIEFSNKKDTLIAENLDFTYPVFSPRNTKSDKVILLLHGLNERSWVKYLVWAYYLAQNTDSWVILFPISFHINRSPSAWKDPRVMIPFMKDRNSSIVEINKSSFANIALSNRLTEDPMRFFKSGYQTTSDIVKLLSAVRDGEHEIIPRTNRFNIFAYSIGAFLAEIILMGNPGNLFSESKLFIFCGGSVFSNMQGSSKLIMDSVAFDRVYNYYLNDFEKTLTGKSPLVEFLRSNQIGMAFRSMIDLGRLKIFRENILKNLKDQIHSLSLLKDSVIPCKGVISTLGNYNKNNIVDVWDFPYAYTHENPFPILKFPLSKKVDYWFERVFAEATMFLA
jgi:pimeloyl-ACP methyl ester carboxylesterase